MTSSSLESSSVIIDADTSAASPTAVAANSHHQLPQLRMSGGGDASIPSRPRPPTLTASAAAAAAAVRSGGSASSCDRQFLHPHDHSADGATSTGASIDRQSSATTRGGQPTKNHCTKFLSDCIDDSTNLHTLLISTALHCPSLHKSYLGVLSFHLF